MTASGGKLTSRVCPWVTRVVHTPGQSASGILSHDSPSCISWHSNVRKLPWWRTRLLRLKFHQLMSGIWILRWVNVFISYLRVVGNYWEQVSFTSLGSSPVSESLRDGVKNNSPPGCDGYIVLEKLSSLAYWTASCHSQWWMFNPF